MNQTIEKLIKHFAKLPRVGHKAASRIVLSLLQDKTGKAMGLASALRDASENISPCKNCGALTDVNNNKCEICNDASRGNGALCIVRDLSDIWTLEKAGIFSGRYHVLGGLISGMNGITPNDLHIYNLSKRIESENITEIIFALPNTIEAKTTAHYIMGIIGENNINLKELASCVPFGGDERFRGEAKKGIWAEFFIRFKFNWSHCAKCA